MFQRSIWTKKYAYFRIHISHERALGALEAVGAAHLNCEVVFRKKAHTIHMILKYWHCARVWIIRISATYSEL